MLTLFCTVTFVAWSLYAAMLMGMGSLVLRSVGGDYSLSDGFWLGLGVWVAFLELYHFFRAIDLVAVLLPAALGLFGLIVTRKWFWDRLRRAVGTAPGFTIAYSAVIVAIAIRAAGPYNHFDTGLYGAGAVRWIRTYPLIPGLGNVHWRLALDSSVFLCVGAMAQGPWGSLSFRFFDGFLLVALIGSLLPAFWRLSSGRSRSTADWFQSFLLVPAGNQIINGQIIGTNTDWPAAVACFAGVVLVFGLLCDDNPNRTDARTTAFVAAVLLSLAVTFKSSVIVLAGITWVVLIVWVYLQKTSDRIKRNTVLACVSFSGVILLPWMFRRLILAGYPLYPGPFLAIPMDWRVPAAVARYANANVRTWARTMGGTVPDAQGLGWIHAWFRGVWFYREIIQMPLFLSLAGSLIMVIKPAKEHARRALWLLVPSVMGVAFWFASAPDPRFGEAALWTLGATLASVGIAPLLAKSGLGWVRGALVLILLTTWWCAGIRSIANSYRPLFSLRRLPALPVTRLVERQTESRLTVYMPAAGDQCWDAPLPCLPYFNPKLRLRQPGQMRSGFISEGMPEVPAWQPTSLLSDPVAQR